jgi:hypothetical protein
MAPGKVIEMLDGIAENVPHSGKIAIDVNFFNAGGNNVVVDWSYPRAVDGVGLAVKVLRW